MSKKIVVVESDSWAARLVKTTLTDRGYDVVVVTDGSEGLRIIKTEQPDLVLVGFKLSIISGGELCHRLRSDKSLDRTHIIMIADESNLEALVIGPGGADDYLLKPFTPADLINKISPWLANLDRDLMLSIGSGELDRRLDGGLAIGSLVLIEGNPESGKSTLCQQMVHGMLVDGFRVSLFTNESSIRHFLIRMYNLNLDIHDQLLLGWLKIYPIKISYLGDDAPKRLMQALRREHESDVLLVDSLTAFIHRSTDQDVSAFFEACKRLCAEDISVVLVVHSHSISQEVLKHIRLLCDVYIRLRDNKVSQRPVKTLEVLKARGVDRVMGHILDFEVDPDDGIQIEPSKQTL